MELMLTRVAQAVYVRAGFGRDQAAVRGQTIASFLMAHLDECRRQFSTDDEFELARLLALAMLAPSASRRAD